MKKKDILFLLWSAVVLVFAWVIFAIIHTLSSSTISPQTNQQIASIKPNFDTKTIDILKKRNVVNPLYDLSETLASGAALRPSPTPISLPGLIIPIATRSSSFASGGGSLNQ